MSFFKDFKEDLSQAVNELLPEVNTDGSNDIMAEEPQMVDTITDDAPAFEKDDIASMLDSIAPDVSPAPTAPKFTDVTTSDDGQFTFTDTYVSEPEVEAPVIPDPEPVTPVYSDPIPPAVPVIPEAPAAPVIPEAPVAPAEPASAPIPTAPVMEAPKPAEPASAPIPTAPVMEAPKPETPAPQIIEEQKTPVAPVFEQSAPVVEEEKRPVEPVFAPSSAERPAPINTTMEDFSMETGIIISGMTIKGDVVSDGNLDVCGIVTGNITIQGKLSITGTVEGNSQAEEVFADGAHINGEIQAAGAVKIGEGAVIKGNISATSAVLAGAVKGDIDVQGPVILDSTAIIMGNIKSKSIQINNGAVIEGLCSQCYADVSPMSFFGEDKKTK